METSNVTPIADPNVASAAPKWARLATRVFQLVILVLAAWGIPVFLAGQIRPLTDVGGPEDMEGESWLRGAAFVVAMALALAGIARLRRASSWNLAGAALASACFAAIAFRLRAHAFIDGPELPVVGQAIACAGISSLLFATSRSRWGWVWGVGALLVFFVGGVWLDGTSHPEPTGLELFPGDWRVMLDSSWFWCLTLFSSVALGGWIGSESPLRSWLCSTPPRQAAQRLPGGK